MNRLFKGMDIMISSFSVTENEFPLGNHQFHPLMGFDVTGLEGVDS